jgi:hypothetical protein
LQYSSGTWRLSGRSFNLKNSFNANTLLSSG